MLGQLQTERWICGAHLHNDTDVYKTDLHLDSSLIIFPEWNCDFKVCICVCAWLRLENPPSRNHPGILRLFDNICMCSSKWLRSMIILLFVCPVRDKTVEAEAFHHQSHHHHHIYK